MVRRPEGTVASVPNSWMFPLVYFLAAGVGFLPFHVGVRHVFVCAASAGIGGVGLAASRRRLRLDYRLYVALEFVAISAIVWASGGILSPLVFLFLVPILQCSMRYGQPWGVIIGGAAALALTGCDLLVKGGESHWELDRLVAVYPFLLLVGFVTAALADARQREVAARAAEAARYEMEQRALAREMEIAAEIQGTLMPRDVPAPPGWQVEWRMKPHRAVGGDLVQLIPVERELVAVVADVTGKGVSAAIMVGSLHQMFHSLAGLPPHEAVQEVNRALCRNAPDGISVSAVLLRLDLESGEVRFCNAGHPYPLVLRAATGELEEWTRNDLMAGWFEGDPFHTFQERLEPGDTLLLYTDGLTDAVTQDGHRIQDSGVRDLLRSAGAKPLGRVAEALLEAVAAGRQVDDVTLLVLRRDPAPRPKEERRSVPVSARHQSLR